MYLKRVLAASLALGLASAWAAEPLTTREELREVFKEQGSAARGARLFEVCTACHGREGNGKADEGIPVIAQQHQRVLAKQLVDYRHAERWDLQMENVAARHKLGPARDLADVAAYVSALQRAPSSGTGDGRHLAVGAQAYARDCASCHGTEGEGNGVTLVPRVAGQHYKYLLRQLHDTLEERRPNMPPPHAQLLSPYGVDELTGIADHLSRLQPSRHVLPRR